MGLSISVSLVCGRSRAGKTTYAKRFGNAIHLDDYGIGDKAYPRVADKVSKTIGDVVVEGIYNTPERRKTLLDVCPNKRKICIWLDTPLDEIERRFYKWKPRNLPHKFEPPTLDEGWDEIIILRGDDEQRIHRQTED